MLRVWSHQNMKTLYGLGTNNSPLINIVESSENYVFRYTQSRCQSISYLIDQSVSHSIVNQSVNQSTNQSVAVGWLLYLQNTQTDTY